MILHVTPAYGRDYKSKAAAQKDWDEEKDFRINDISHPDDGRYVNKQQTGPNDMIMLRYGGLRKVMRLENIHK